MKIPLLFICLAFLTFTACTKSKDELTADCIQVRYVGTGCRDVLQVLTPISTNSTESWGLGGNVVYENCIAVEKLSDQYKDGQAFQINVKSVYLVGLIHNDCTVPRHEITFSVCQDTVPSF